MMGVSGFLSLQWLTFMKWFLIILGLNIGVVIAGRMLSKNYVKNHKATTYAFFFLNDFRGKLYDTRYRCFEEDEVACWKEEIENVKKGRTTAAINKPICPIVKQNLQEKYETLGSQIEEKQNNISQLSNTIEGVNVQSLKLAEDLKARESGINALISDREHNNGVLERLILLQKTLLIRQRKCNINRWWICAVPQRNIAMTHCEAILKKL